MKNTMKLFWLLAAASVVLSCSKEAGQNLEATPGEEKTPAVITPATDGNLLTSFGVTFEGDVQDEETKVSVTLDTGVTEMEENDEVLVFVDADNNAIYKYDGSKFVLKEGETAVTLSSTASVFYPANEFGKTTAIFTMPPSIEASGDFGAINPMAGVVTESGGDYSVELGNVASILRVNVSADVNINSVTLDFGTGVTYAAGSTFTVDASAKTMTASAASAETTQTVYLGTPATTADVLFILPTLELTNGLTVTANLAGNHNGGTNTFSVSKAAAYTPTVNKISSMSFYAGLFSGGAGTSVSPYLISKARDFKNFQKYTTGGYRDAEGFRAADFLAAHYMQTADIAAGDMTPIGTSSAPFTGEYNGNNQTLTVNIGTDTQYTGVFGYINGANISNLTVEGNVTSSEVIVGGIAGAARGSHITGCTNNADVSTTSSTANAYVGGIVGNANLTDANEVVSCTNSGTITGHVFTGGITGDFLGTADMCINKGIVTSDNSNVGGISGSLRANSVIKRCYSANFNTSTGSPRVQGQFRVGGIVGIQNGANSKVVNCISRSSIIGTATAGTITSTAVGGIVGELRSGLVANCLAGASDSRIINTKTANAYVGLIVGYIQSANGTVQNCYSRQVANNFGYFTYTAPNSFTRKTSAAGNTTAMGQVYGYNNGGTVKDCYYRGHTNGVATGGAQAGSTETNVTMVSADATTIFNDASANVPVVITLSDGATTYGADTKKLWEILSGGASLISGYTPATGELMTWEYKSGSEPIVPSEMIRLGDDFWTN